MSTQSDPDALFQDHVLNAPDCCSNCFRLAREERVNVVPTDFVDAAVLTDVPTGDTENGRAVVQGSHYGRSIEFTSAEYPTTDIPSDSRRVFCRCGVASVFHREWSDARLLEDRDRFRELLKHLTRTLDRKGVSHDRKTLFAVALGGYDRCPHPREAIVPLDAPEDLNAVLASAVQSAVAVATSR